MSEDKSTKNSDAAKPTSATVSPAPKEPKQDSAKPAGAKPAKAKIARDAVVGAGETDPVMYSKAKVPGRTEGRKSLTVLHIQRRLMDEGFAEAASAPGGQYEALTTRAVQAYQESIKAEPTGVLTRNQFAELFEGDPNVSVTIDTHFDHTV